MYILPASIKKTIRFIRLSSKNVLSYEIYTKTIDDTYESGIKTELIDTIKNPNIPTPYLKKIDLEHSINNTWELPSDIYLDKDHKLRVFINGIPISNLYFTINKVAKIFTINSNAITVNPDSKIQIEYYQDIIEKSYMVDEDCNFIIKPIMIDSHHYGKHNVIL